jgi:hypothetical protein
MKSLLDTSKRNAGWLRRKPDNKLKESIEQLAKSDRKTDEANSTIETKNTTKYN